MKKIAILTVLIFASLMAVNVQGAVTTYYVREDFNDLNGWNIPSGANVTTENGELVMGMPTTYGNPAQQQINKSVSVGKKLDNLEISMNIKAKTLGEPDYGTATGSYYHSNIQVCVIGETTSFSIALHETFTDDIYDGLYGGSIYVSGQGDDMPYFSVTIMNRNYHEVQHNTWYEGAVKMEMKKVSPASYSVTIHRYGRYNFTGELSPYTFVCHFSEKVEKITTTCRDYTYDTTDSVRLNSTTKSDYIYVLSNEKESTSPTQGASEMALYLLPAVILGVGIFTAVMGNSRYVYLILTAFLLFGVMAIIDSQYILSAIGFLSTGIYGYKLKGGGFFA